MGIVKGDVHRRSGSVRRCAAVAIAALLAAGCGTDTDTEAGTATSVTPSASAPTGAVDVSALDVGNYPTSPAAPLGAAGTEVKGKLADARRLADFVVGPWDVDPSLIGAYATTASVLKGPAALELIGPKSVADAAAKHPFVNGFTSSRTNDAATILTNAVVRFADDAAATAAAADMAAAVLAELTSGANRTPVPIPGHPGAAASSYPFTDPEVGKEQSTVRSFTPRGPYVLIQLSQTYEGLDAAVKRVATALDLQTPLIDQFQPTPPADFAALPLDPSGLLARTILVPDAEANVNQNWAYGPRGALHFQIDPTQTAPLFTQSGTDLVASGKTVLYQSVDAAAATSLAAALTNQLLGQQARPADPVAGLPDSTCLQSPALGFLCTATADRYVIEAQSTQPRDAHQLLAAQYVLLTAP